MNTASQQSRQTTEREFTITRVFDAPREMVWKAFTEPEHMKEWWGPRAQPSSPQKWIYGSAARITAPCATPPATSSGPSSFIVKSLRLIALYGCTPSRTKPAASRDIR